MFLPLPIKLVRILLVFLLLLTSALSCSGGKDRKHLLPVALEEFNAAIRWKQYRTAARFVVPDVSLKLVRRLRTTSKDLEFVEVELVDQTIAPDGKSAACLVQFAWYSASDLTVKKGLELQEWRVVDERWLLFRQLPPADKKATKSPFVE